MSFRKFNKLVDAISNANRYETVFAKEVRIGCRIYIVTTKVC